MSDDFHDKLLKRLSMPEGHILTYYEVMRWPKGKLDELMQHGIVREGGISETVQCVECSEGCVILPDVRRHPDTEELFGVYVCPRDEDIGRFEVDLERRRRWEIVTQKTTKREKRKKKLAEKENAKPELKNAETLRGDNTKTPSSKYTLEIREMIDDMKDKRHTAKEIVEKLNKLYPKTKKFTPGAIRTHLSRLNKKQ